MRSLLLGPMQVDEVLESDPSDTYLTGILWQRGALLGAEEDEGGSDRGGGDDEGAADLPVPGYRAIKPCSIGVTCAVDDDVMIRIDLDGTAKYVPARMGEADYGDDGSRNGKPETDAPADAQSEQAGDATAADAEGAGRRTGTLWQRSPLDYSLTLPPGGTSTRTNEFTRANGSVFRDPDVCIDVRRRIVHGRHVLTATLINTAPARKGGSSDDLLLFQARVRVTARHPDGAPAIRPRTVPPLADDEDSRTNMLLYRDVHEFAVGHGVAAEWEQDGADAVGWVATSWMPARVVSGTSAAGHPDLGQIREGATDPLAAAWLGEEGGRDPVCGALDAFCDIYGGWIERELAARVDSLPVDMHEGALENLARCRETLRRMREVSAC